MSIDLSAEPPNISLRNVGVHVSMPSRSIPTKMCIRDSPYAVYNPESGEYENGPMPKGSHLNAIDHMFVYGHEQLDVRVFNVVTEQEALDVSDHCPI